MDIRLFKTFILVAEMLNITRAAEQLNFSQPAVTAQISSLEDDFQVQLFERRGKRLHLTAAGRTMLGYSRQIVSLYEETRNVMAGFSQSGSAVRLAISSQMINYFLAPLLHKLQKAHQDLNVTVDICRTIREVELGLLECRYDLGFVHARHTMKNIRQYAVWKDDVLWVASPDFAASHAADIASGCSLPIINYNEGSVFRAKLNESQATHKLHSSIEYSDSEAIKHAVLSGLGISYLSRRLIKDELAAHKLVEVKSEPLLQMEISLLCAQERGFTLPVQELLAALADEPDADRSIHALC